MTENTKENIPSFVYVTYIATTPEKLWTALTESEFTKQYFWGRKVQSNWQVGSVINYLTEDNQLDIQGEIIECDKPKKLSFTFKGPNDNSYIREKPTCVTFELKQMGAMVRLTLIHENLIEADLEKNPNTFRGLNNGWPAIISNLKSVIETGKKLEFVMP